MRVQRFRESIRALVMHGLPESEVRSMLDFNIDIFEMGVNRLDLLFKLPEKWGVDK